MKKYIEPTIDIIFFEGEDVQTTSNVGGEVNAWSTLDDDVLTDAGVEAQPRIVNVNVEKVNVF
jgi:hypothetical protein